MGIWTSSASGGGAGATTGTYASRPSSASTGALYFATDVGVLFIWNGSAWVSYGPLNKFTSPPAVSTLTAINAGGRTTTSTDTGGGILMVATDGANADDYRLRKVTAPVTGYSFVVHCLPTLESLNYGFAGICFRNSTSGNITAFGIGMASGLPVLYVRHETASGNGASPTFTYSSDLVSTGHALFGQGIWLKLTDDLSTTKTYQVSHDGVNFLTIGSHARTTHITPDEVGLVIAPRMISGGTSTKAQALFGSYSLG